LLQLHWQLRMLDLLLLDLLLLALLLLALLLQQLLQHLDHDLPLLLLLVLVLVLLLLLMLLVLLVLLVLLLLLLLLNLLLLLLVLQQPRDQSAQRVAPRAEHTGVEEGLPQQRLHRRAGDGRRGRGRHRRRARLWLGLALRQLQLERPRHPGWRQSRCRCALVSDAWRSLLVATGRRAPVPTAAPRAGPGQRLARVAAAPVAAAFLFLV
jgi:Ca2+/Na+ antiporter